MKHIIYTVLLIILVSCNETESNVIENEIHINPNKTSDLSCLDSLISVEEYIKLESNKNCPISQIDKLQEKDNIFYLLDREVKQLLTFQTTGKFIKRIKNIGKGKGEYLSLDDFQIVNSSIYLFSRASKKILQYDLSFCLIKEIKLDHYYSRIHVLKNNTCILYRNYNSNISKTNFQIISLNSHKTIGQMYNIKKEQFGQGYKHKVFEKYKEKLYISLPLDYNIYEYVNENLNSKYKICFPNSFSLPENAKYFNYAELDNYLKYNPKTISIIKDFTIIEDQLLFTYLHNYQLFLVIYNINNRTVQYNGIFQASLKRPFGWDSFIGKSDKYLYSFIDAEMVTSTLKLGTEEFQQAKRSINFTSNINAMDNPIIVKVKIKK